jgi:hypothetical protein
METQIITSNRGSYKYHLNKHTIEALSRCGDSVVSIVALRASFFTFFRRAEAGGPPVDIASGSECTHSVWAARLTERGHLVIGCRRFSISATKALAKWAGRTGV